MLGRENSELVRRYWDEFVNKHDLAQADEILALDFVLYDPLSPTPVNGRETFVQMLSELFRAFPDIQYTAEEQVAEGNKVWIRWTMRASNALRVEANLLGLAHQLGAVPNLDLA